MSKFEEFLRTPNVGYLAVVLIRGDCVYIYRKFKKVDLKNLICKHRAVGRSENPGVPVLFGGHNMPPWLRYG